MLECNIWNSVYAAGGRKINVIGKSEEEEKGGRRRDGKTERRML